jgi:ABC-type branched-subunit amino acid transport system permease subunit
LSTLAQALADGILQGGILALTAVGFTLAWGVLNIVNLAHGAFVVLGAYVAWECAVTLGTGPFGGAVAAAAVLFLFGYALQAAVLNRVALAPLLVILLVTFGIGLALVGAMQAVFSADYRSIPTSYLVTSIHAGAVYIPVVQLVTMVLGIVLSAGVAVFLHRTRAGLAVRAVGMDHEAAQLIRIPVRHVYALTMGVAAALAGVAGAMIATVGTFQPSSAVSLTLESSVIAVAGGIGNTNGAIAGGLLFGIVVTLSQQYLPGEMVDAIAFGLLLAVLTFRPAGLIGRSPHLVAAISRTDFRAVSAGDRAPADVAARWQRRAWAGRLGFPAAAVIVVGVAAAVAGIALPGGDLAAPDGVLMLVTLAESWNLLGGFAGYASFGHVAFYGIGGYAAAVAMSHAGVGYLIAVPMVAVSCAAFAIAIGLPLLRLRGAAFSIATLGMAAGIQEIVTDLPGLTGGGAGLTIPIYRDSALGGYPSARTFYLMYLGLAVLTVTVVALVARSRLGTAMRTLRDDEEVAAALGVPTTRTKVTALTLSGVLAGLAGSIVAFQQVFIFPDSAFDVTLTALAIAAVVAGGAGTVCGPVLGAVVLGSVYEYLSRSGSVSSTLLLAVVIAIAGMCLPLGHGWRSSSGGSLRQVLTRYRV